MSLHFVMNELQQLGNAQVAQRKAKDFGIPVNNALGIYMADLKMLAKEIGIDSQLALELIDTGVYEARILASKIFRPKDITADLMDEWVEFFDTWEICDAFCMQVFKYSHDSWDKIFQWSLNNEEFVKRAAFVIMATYGQGHKETPNDQYETCYPIILREAGDDRNFVKKAINWAIREIGKRNIDLQDRCIMLCEDLLALDLKSANWIAKNALRELEDPLVRIRDYPRSIYRP